MALAPMVTAAQTFTTLYKFTGAADGAMPTRGPTLDKAGHLFGQTLQGGNNCADAFGSQGVGCGTLYEGSGTTLTTIHTFTGPGGAAPDGTPTDIHGLLYGTTITGGADNLGTVYSIQANGKSPTLLHSFAGPDGAMPSSVVRVDSAGNRYSVAYRGDIGFTGSETGNGVLFEITAAGQYTILYAFTGGADGQNPGRIFFDPSGNIFGSTAFGGTCNSSMYPAGCGTIYKYVPSTGVLTTLHSFIGQDGETPALAGIDKNGNLFGMTTYGGQFSSGTLFELVAGPSSTYTFVKLHDFTGGNDGATPIGAPALTSTDTLLGTTQIGPFQGFNLGFGVAYAFKNGKFTTLHIFSGGADGAYPEGTPVIAADGTLFGNTANGGIQPCNALDGVEISFYGCGTLFSIKR